MRIFLPRAALARIEPALSSLGLPLDIVTVDGARAIRRGDTVLTARDVAAEAIWISLDAFIGRQLGLFFEVALGGDGVRFVQTFNAGLDGPYFRQIFDRGIQLANSNAQAPAIAEYVVANVIAEYHPIARHRQSDRQWQRVPFRELGDACWLIIGFGNIGREIARRARAFGGTIIGVRRTPGADPLTDEIAPPEALPRLLPRADIVVLAAGLTPETADLADAGFFAAMKPGSILVNIGRGGLVVDEALLAGLDKGTPSVAILDVFREEPLPPTNPFWDHPRVRVTAHCSAAGSGTIARGDRLFLDNLQRYARGEPLINAVTERNFG
jgi:phosphoglycerate dehydrogenase-like enzyme